MDERGAIVKDGIKRLPLPPPLLLRVIEYVEVSVHMWCQVYLVSLVKRIQMWLV